MNKRDRTFFVKMRNWLCNRPTRAEGSNPFTDAEVLRRAAMTLRRIAERECREDTGCPKCHGNGIVDVDMSGKSVECRKCAGTGSILGPRSVGAEKRAAEVAGRYGLRVYVQGDPRGWPLYLIPAESYPSPAGDASNYSLRGYAVCPR